MLMETKVNQSRSVGGMHTFPSACFQLTSIQRQVIHVLDQDQDRTYKENQMDAEMTETVHNFVCGITTGMSN